MAKFKSNPDKTILTIVIGLLIVYYLSKIDGFLIASILIGLIGVFSRYLSIKIESLWMKLALVLSYIVPNILLTFIFYIFLTPIALLSRIGNKNLLQLRKTDESMFKDRTTLIKPSDFEKTW
jgi:hypothetical protein